MFTKVRSSCLYVYLSTTSKESGEGVQFHSFLNFALDLGEWSASSSGRLTPGDNASPAHCAEGCVGPKARLGAVEKREIFFLQDMKTQFLGNLITISTELSRILKFPQFV
jgi:hypothetical protein